MKRPYKKGEKVRSGFWAREAHIVRKVVSCIQTEEGDWLVSADGGEPCPHRNCGYQGRPTPPLSPDWFSKVEE